ncbi:hypothetical protein CPB84DRAFT_1826528 [Gymnopilus junonius]|uniref:RING-type domain-containing protein n=1 Tax=Gymnopilus junonius TaxID=109634 RepID=A0A9P5NGK3_GYMJU|nr:hypothetical protein CPB84DRAFT_1826528 [Gymnopilus junonius]
MSSRSHPHHSLPAPVVHATFSAPQSKSHVLAGVQDAYWSDDEAEDAECPLCLEEMDISDLNFKPCICGYQICRFCWHHIKENLNKRCPACRRIYTDDAVEFKPIATQDHKRLTQQKKQRDRERKDLEALGRRHLANVRVVQRNVVYVVGIGPRFAKEELIPTLRSNEYFGQYGKITKILLVKRTSPGGGGPVVGLYITYHRREDAARAIGAVDGTPSPGGGREVMRASYGTTKYCMAFLRGVACSDHSCMNLHEWGDEKDCFTKEDLTTLKHTMKATESRTRTVTVKKGEEDAGLPRAASWGQKGSSNSHVQSGLNGHSQANNVVTSSTGMRQTRRIGLTRLSRGATNTSTLSTGDGRSPQPKSSSDRKTLQTPASRPSTPVLVEQSPLPISNEVEAVKQKEGTQSLGSPVPQASIDINNNPQEPLPDRLESTYSPSLDVSASPSKMPNVPLAPPGLTQPPGLSPPPGLFAPPGISSPSRPPRMETTSPQTPLLASQSSYQMSNAARALLDDVKARRESAMQTVSAFSPFPDFDRTLQTLSEEGGGGFSFNLDPKLADEADSTGQLPDFDVASTIPFHGSYIDAFPALRSGSPYLPSSSLAYSQATNHAIYDPSAVRAASVSVPERQTIRGAGYLGPFDPFSEPPVETSFSPSMKPQHSPVDEERKVSRFGFARGRQNSTTTSSPHSPMNYGKDLQPFYQLSDEANSMQSWPSALHDVSSANALQHPSHQPTLMLQNQNQSSLPSVNGALSEAQLRSFIQSSQEKENNSNSMRAPFGSTQPFNDPAIMSASFATPATENFFSSVEYGPPPGLPLPQRLSSSPVMGHRHQSSVGMDTRNSFTEVATAVSSPSPSILSPEDFPALTSITSDPSLASAQASELDNKTTASIVKGPKKAERKVARKAAAAERAQQKLAQEKAEARALEKAKIAKEKEQAQALLHSQHSERPTTEKSINNVSQDSSKSSSGKPNLVRQEVALGAIPPKKSAHRVKAADSSATAKKQEEASKSSIRPGASVKTLDPPKTEMLAQVPLLSKKPKKSKPIVKTVKVHKEDDMHEELAPPSATDTPAFPAESNSSNSRSQSVDSRQTPTRIQDILIRIDNMNPSMDLPNHPFFDIQRLTSPAKMPLEYGPLTISDLLRLLPRTTWDDSSSFDGVLRDMLKGDDFLDDGEESAGREDEVAALTLALERRARWMEVQLSKLEELHRDINTAAVRAVLSFNDSGWDRHGFLPHIGNTLRRFESIGMVEEQGGIRSMTADELQKKLLVAKEAAIFAETEIREAMENIQGNGLLWS